MTIESEFSAHAGQARYLSHQFWELNGEPCLEITFSAPHGKSKTVNCRLGYGRLGREVELAGAAEVGKAAAEHWAEKA